MRVNIPKDNPNMICQAVPLQSQSMVSNQQDHDPPSRPERHSSPQSPSTATHHEPPPRSWSNASTRCQRDTGWLNLELGGASCGIPAPLRLISSTPAPLHKTSAHLPCLRQIVRSPV
ncbi:unnamed protein product [Pleuronectes platessa]|uniref:Uncharacterized protein n=1 Tax=Pleuronectes platessa TaxID=8262 RepID=A0A9N7YPY9_PLEPL|nr:unnamed protein product [Pleuronectes platessa]